MNRKILTLAVATALVVPMASQADVRLSGLIQAEIGSWEVAGGDETNAYRTDGSQETNDMSRQTRTYDEGGAITNYGPSNILLQFDEKLGTSGITANGQYQVGFNTSNNKGLTGKKPVWVGLKSQNFYFRYGTLSGAYKSSRTLIDPWSYTSLQASGTAGGMSGNRYHSVTEGQNGKFLVNTNAKVSDSNGLTNEGFVDGALELGVHFGGFVFKIQGVVDDAADMDGAGLLELRYEAPSFAMWASASYTDLDIKDTFDDAIDDVKDAVDEIQDDITSDEADAREAAREEDDGLGNWKVGGQFKLDNRLKVGLQYEEAEMGHFDNNPDGGNYIIGSIQATMNNMTLAAWIGAYSSDIDDKNRMVDVDGTSMDEDALSWAVGVKYNFSKRSQVYLGYRQTDSDNDYRDEDIAVLGIRQSF
ncbi:porin [Candidatus Halobeggiatoa sp. HSG11]|nr:porin [Candidatus Halobeggiatoa sp. HSG11]